MKPQIVAELVTYKSRMLPFMPGRRTADKESAFFAIFSTMIGAIEIARLLPNPAMGKKCSGTQEGKCEHQRDGSRQCKPLLLT